MIVLNSIAKGFLVSIIWCIPIYIAIHSVLNDFTHFTIIHTHTHTHVLHHPRPFS